MSIEQILEYIGKSDALQGMLAILALFPLILGLLKSYTPRDKFTRHSQSLYVGPREEHEFFRERYLFERLYVFGPRYYFHMRGRWFATIAVVALLLTLYASTKVFQNPYLWGPISYASMFLFLRWMRHNFYLQRQYRRWTVYTANNLADLEMLKVYAASNKEAFLRMRPL